MSKEVMQQALEFCESLSAYELSPLMTEHLDGITAALRQALAEPEQEPVAYLHTNIRGFAILHRTKKIGHVGPNYEREIFDDDKKAAAEYPNAHAFTPLYTSAPPPRKPVDLTDEELEPLIDAAQCYDIGNSDLLDFARAVIAAYEKKQGEQA